MKSSSGSQHFSSVIKKKLNKRVTGTLEKKIKTYNHGINHFIIFYN